MIKWARVDKNEENVRRHHHHHHYNCCYCWVYCICSFSLSNNVWTVCKMSMFVWIAEIVLFIFGLIYILFKGFRGRGNGRVSDADDVKWSLVHIRESHSLAWIWLCQLVYLSTSGCLCLKTYPWTRIIIPSIIWQVWHRLFNVTTICACFDESGHAPACRLTLLSCRNVMHW